MKLSRNRLISISKIFLALLILGVIYHTIDVSLVAQTIENSNKLLIIASLPFYLLTRVIKMYIWKINLSTQDIHIKKLKSIKSIFAASIPSLVAPGVIGGFARPIYLKDNYDVPLKNGLPAFILEQFLSVTSYSIIIAIVTIIAFSKELYSAGILLSFLFVFFITAQIAFLYAVFGQKYTQLIGKIPFFQKILDNRKHLQKSFRKRKKILKSITLQLTIYIGTVGISSYILLLSLSHRPEIWEAAFIPSVAQSMSLIPVTPGGLGTIEISGIFLMSEFSMPAKIATSFFLLRRVIPTAVITPIGYIVGWEWIDSKKSD